MKGFGVDDIATIGGIMSILISAITLWNVNKGIIKRLVIIQNRLSNLKALHISLRGNVNDIEAFLSAKDNYNIRLSSERLENQLSKEYDSGDTGF
ncbi:MAG: hypothetical protein ABI417_08945 [Coleofasciculaceae cyanobacterium]